MTRKRSDDSEVIDIKDAKKQLKISDLTKEYIRKRKELDSET